VYGLEGGSTPVECRRAAEKRPAEKRPGSFRWLMLRCGPIPIPGYRPRVRLGFAPRKKLSSKLSNRYRKTRVWYVFGPRIVQNPRFRDRRSPWKRIQVPVGATPWGFKSPLSHRQSFHTLADTDHDPAPAGFLVCWTSPLAIIPSSSSIMRQPLPSSGSLRVGSPPSTVQ
jgi:hypothetical protein